MFKLEFLQICDISRNDPSVVHISALIMAAREFSVLGHSGHFRDTFLSVKSLNSSNFY